MSYSNTTQLLSNNQPTPEHQLSQKLYAEVVVNIPLDRIFHYSVPSHLRDRLSPGMRVRAPFGNKIITGFCVGFTDTPFSDKIKDIISIVDKAPLAGNVMLKITRWIASYYHCGWGEAINAVIPPVARTRTKEKGALFVVHTHKISELNAEMLSQIKIRAPKQARALEILKEHAGEISAKELMHISGCMMQGLRQLEKKGFVTFKTKSLDELDIPCDSNLLQKHLMFTDEQQSAFDTITKKLLQTRPGVVLLQGVTGSGKTEIYLQTITKVVEQGRSVIFLVPEISLTSQTIRRIKARFDRVAILHSHLLGTFHYSQWNDIREGNVDIVIGARSAIFAPLKNVGLIIIDEEHENTFKQENSPRYNARDVSIVRATHENALVILGTATPSLESYYHAYLGDYEKVGLSKRIGGRQLPPVEIVDMAEEARKRRGYHIISQKLEYYTKQSLARGEQVILFLNRRGFAPYIHCKRCGFVLKCKRCDIPMTFHRKLNTTLCHYCRAEEHPPESCPDCLASNINYRGFGTEKIEDEIMARFPDYKIVRMDSDSMRVRDAHEKALTAFERGEFQILLGTQMIAKGLDFPNVTLVGVISADTILNLPDFRASERTFQLISQVAGRTGRGSKGGRVVVQSFNPRHYSITYAASHDYEGFAKKELEYRKQLNYPPYGKLARIVFRSAQEDKAKEKAFLVAEKLKDMVKSNGKQLDILGPSPAPLTKINDQFRWHLLLKSIEEKSIHDALHSINDVLRPSKGVQTMVDVDPYMML
ncbi:MAG TPA: replication restart helicase PriA [Candidatus Brocadiaceae bacterium]